MGRGREEGRQREEADRSGRDAEDGAGAHHHATPALADASSNARQHAELVVSDGGRT